MEVPPLTAGQKSQRAGGSFDLGSEFHCQSTPGSLRWDIPNGISPQRNISPYKRGVILLCPILGLEQDMWGGTGVLVGDEQPK